MKILLHICCAPCSPFPIEELKRLGHVFQGFFFNPNIHPFREFELRKETLQSYARQIGLKVECNIEYDIKTFLRGLIAEEEKGSIRCFQCYRMRLDRAAEAAKARGFEAFTTTLLVSPYQKHELIIQAAHEVQEARNFEFFYRDFRPGWPISRQQTFFHGLYRQKYCGCIFSEKERQEERKEKMKSKV